MDEMAKVMGNSNSINGDFMSGSPDLSVNMISKERKWLNIALVQMVEICSFLICITSIFNFLTGLGKNQMQDSEPNQLSYPYTFVCYLLLRRASLYYSSSSFTSSLTESFPTRFLRNYFTNVIFIARLKKLIPFPLRLSKASDTRKL